MSKPKEDNKLTEETLGKVSGGANGSQIDVVNILTKLRNLINSNSKENYKTPPTNLNK